MKHERTPTNQALTEERQELLLQLEAWLEAPMLMLAFAWLALIVAELIWGLHPLLDTVCVIIWAMFLLEFAVRLLLAPEKLVFLRRNWLAAIALMLPALRIFRVIRLLRLARAARGLRLVRVLSGLNRGMRALRASMRRRGFGYVLALTLLVTLVGAAGMYAFERDAQASRGLNDYGTALWWTAMVMTTMGSDYWPQTTEGRILCVLLALYAFAIFGYVTATLATFFIGRDAESAEGELAGARAIDALQVEIAALRSEVQALSRRTPESTQAHEPG
jgi:voltage-gated potassium channel